MNLLTTGDNAASAQQRTRILVVDDDRLRLYVNSVILRQERYDVLACLNPGIATRLLRVERIDVAILDYRMPEMNGVELAKVCKSLHPEMKVILFSGELHIDNRELAFVDLCIAKSEGVRALLKGVKALIQ